MIEQLTNASAMRTIGAIAVVAGLSWLGDVVTGQTPSASAAYYGAALIIITVVVDHLHGIRAELATLNRLQHGDKNGLS